jgi:hypothetical protein
MPRTCRWSPYSWNICVPVLIPLNSCQSHLPNSRNANIFKKSRSQLKILDGIKVTLKQVPYSGPTDIRCHNKKFGHQGLVHPCLRHRVYLVFDNIPEVSILLISKYPKLRFHIFSITHPTMVTYTYTKREVSFTKAQHRSSSVFQLFKMEGTFYCSGTTVMWHNS